MIGLDQEQVDWLYRELQSMIVWDAPTGRLHALPLYVALVAILSGLRHNLAAGIIGELFGCSGSTVERYQERADNVGARSLTSTRTM